jgi:predicted phosphodiesterase
MLIFGGPYSNLQAMTDLRKKAEQFGISPANCLCTGDIVAYCAQPQETAEFIKDWGISCVMGNCEEAFANKTDDCGCGFEEGSQCDLLSNQWFNFANQQLHCNVRQWFASLPRSITFELNGMTAEVVHGSPSAINRFMFASTSEEVFREELARSCAELMIGGHCGIPFTKSIGGRIWHNAGAIGLPANDGTPRTWFSLLEVIGHTLTINTHALDYDYVSAQQMMIDAGMDNGYAKALCSGLWPSMDVLPEAEQSQQGTPLKLRQYVIARNASEQHEPEGYSRQMRTTRLR